MSGQVIRWFRRPVYLQELLIETSTYQLMKIHVLNAVDLSRDAIHIYVGMAVLLLFVIIFQRGRFSLVSLVPVFVVAIIMEVFDLYDDSRTFGYLRWDASLHDVINTVLWPAILVFLARFNFLR